MKKSEDEVMREYIAGEVRGMLGETRPRTRRRSAARRAAAGAALVVLVMSLMMLVLIRAFADGTERPETALPAASWTEVTLTAMRPAAPATTPGPEPEKAPAPETDEGPGSVLTSRYAPVTAAEFDLIARVVYAESNTESIEGQQAVAEVILNRRAAGNFAGSIYDVVYAPGQFSTAPMLERVTPNVVNYSAVWLALYGEAILPLDVVYFSRGAENGNVWGRIGAHVFCRQYVWG